MQGVPPPPPLPPGWSEHLAPGGQVYYYNAHTQESTYVRPLPTFPVYPVPPAPPVVKKEKPLTKTPIPGTEWLRVKTTAGNIFYSHKIKKESVWTIPPEIREAVDALERGERGREQRRQVLVDEKAKGAEVDMSTTEEENLKEIQRVKHEVEEMVKRKAEDVVSIDEVLISKRARVGREEEEEKEEGTEQAGSDEESEEEEEWQREAAAQLAAEADEEAKRGEEEGQRIHEEADAQLQKAKETQPLSMPDRVDLSLEEAKALFKTLLREKDINPLHPWDISLPLFVSDPRYVLLPSVSARREAFDEYCRDRARELRQAAVNKEKKDSNPKEEFDRLLRDELKSTRTSWTEFRREWKKERRFWGWGRDDREREKRFKEYIKELGEKKREAARKAEKDFFALLRDSGLVKPDSLWKDVKRKLSRDPRYDAVGSSSLREELFGTFLKASTSDPQPTADGADGEAEGQSSRTLKAEKERNSHEKKERAVREREEKVKADLERLEADIDRSRVGLSKEESEQLFRNMLTDAIRDPQLTWERTVQQLKTDSRFSRSPLPLNQQMHLFHAHIGQLRAKHLDNLHSLFESHAHSLASSFDDLPIPTLLSSHPGTKLGIDARSLRHLFDVWQRERNHEVKKQFKEMLAENSFVEFWGRLGKLGGDGIDGGVKADELGEDEGEGGGGKVDMKALAKTVDVADMERVLRNDKRYIVYEHIPEEREQWIREYLSQLAPPRLSVHTSQPSTG